MSSYRSLTMTAGKPFSQKIRVTDGKDVWPNLGDFEVRAQLRAGRTTSDSLIANLHESMSSSFDANDIVIDWSLTGEDTRSMFGLSTWPAKRKRGFFNIILSDVGTVDGRALVVPTISLTMEDTTTTASDS